MRRLVRYLCFAVVSRLALGLFSSFAGLLVLPGIACSLQIVIRSRHRLLLHPPNKPRQVDELICTGFYWHFLFTRKSFFSLILFIFVAHAEYFPYSSLVSTSWHEANSSNPPPPTLFRSLASVLCFVPPILPLCMIVFKQTFSSPVFRLSDHRYAFVGGKSILVPQVDGPEAGNSFNVTLPRHKYQRHLVSPSVTRAFP